ncbi:nucleoid-associated protein [Solitalea longa]
MSQDEALIYSYGPVDLNDQEKTTLLLNYLMKPFQKNEEYYNLQHSSGELNQNYVYKLATTIFESNDNLYNASKLIAKYLFETVQDPKVKGGKLFIAYFTYILVDGEEVNAVGIFKSESIETYMKVSPNQKEIYDFESDQGINLSKLDKGCIIFNLEKDKGYKVAIVDSKSKEGAYWKDEFLNVIKRDDSHAKTDLVIELCSNFLQDKITDHFEMNRAEQVDLLNRASDYFKDKDQFDIQEFSNEVLMQEEVIESFKSHKKSYEDYMEIEIPESFDISTQVVKKKAKEFKRKIKLDSNFLLEITSETNRIEKGLDEETGLSYYKLYFKEEQ